MGKAAAELDVKGSPQSFLSPLQLGSILTPPLMVHPSWSSVTSVLLNPRISSQSSPLTGSHWLS